jgi:hypothetical protein
MDGITALLLVAGAYVAVGAVVGGVFVFKGVDRVDASAKGAGLGFRLIIWPGATALWWLVAAMWLRALGAEVRS